jgi:guanylate kinase
VRRELEAVRRFDYAVVNDVVERSVAAVREIIAAERAGDVARAQALHGVPAVASRVADVLPI